MSTVVEYNVGMPPKKRDWRDVQAPRTAILDNARSQSASHGFERTTIRSVASAAGVDPALVMHYFGSKAALFATASQFEINFPDLSDVRCARIAEEIKFGDVTTGASDDFAKATEIARRMVTQYGMSDNLGPIQYGRGNHQGFLGRDFGEDRNYSEEVAFKIDTEVRKIIDDCYGDARRILEANWDKVERMVASLLEHETVETEEVLAIMNDRPYPPSAEPAGVPELTDAA